MNRSKKTKQHYDARIIQGYEKRLNNMQEHCSQVAVMHLVASMPEGTDAVQGNRCMSRTCESYVKTNRKHGIRTHFGWVREIASEGSGTPHYHIGILVDGQKTQSSVSHAARVNKLLCKQLGSDPDSRRVHYCQPDAEKYDCQATCNKKNLTVIKINRYQPHAEAQRANALNWLSYQAKEATKDHSSERSFAFSKLPSKK